MNQCQYLKGVLYILLICIVNISCTDKSISYKTITDSTYTFKRKEIISLDSNALSLSIPINDITPYQGTLSSVNQPPFKPITKRKEDLIVTVSIDSTNTLQINAISAPVDTIEVTEVHHVRKEKEMLKSPENKSNFMDDLRRVLWLVLAIVAIVFLGRLFFV
jgi:hypothetical protein